MTTATYEKRRGEIARYFDETAVDAWAKLTSDAPVSGVRATVRAGRARMRARLLDWLPHDLSGRRVLDAGSGAGDLAVEAARRGAEVVAIDLSPTMTNLAKDRAPREVRDRITFLSGDMTAPDHGRFDHVVAMDSLIHYARPDLLKAVARLVASSARSVAFTVAPATPLLRVMHVAGKLFPRGDRSPAIMPTSVAGLRKALNREPGLGDWRVCRDGRVSSGFYVSHAVEVRRI